MKNLKDIKSTDGTQFNSFIEVFNKVCEEYDIYNTTTIVTVDDVDYIADEYAIRALQCTASRIAKNEPDKWDKFNARIQVWSDMKKIYKMHFRKDGKFSNEFNCEILNANSNMLFEIL